MRSKKLTIVIASGAGGSFLYRCLDSLRGQISDPEVEVIVVDRCGGETAARVKRDYSFAELVTAEPAARPSVPKLRKMGVEGARGEVIAILEEHCVAPDNWVRTVREELGEGDAAIGGPILENNYQRLRDWVVYFSEYHNYLPPWKKGERFLLNGANIAYDRQLLLKHRDVLDSGYWEVVLHPLLAREAGFCSVPQMGVYHTGPFDYRYYLRQRYLLSRVWGGTQRDNVGSLKRIIYLVLAPLIPFFILARIALRVNASGKNRLKLIACLPLLLPVVVAYVTGEWIGYLLGVGSALEEVE